MTLHSLSPPRASGQGIPPQDTWPATRQIADVLDISIYQARLILLDLARYGLVHVSDKLHCKSLRWYPHASAHTGSVEKMQVR